MVWLLSYYIVIAVCDVFGVCCSVWCLCGDVGVRWSSVRSVRLWFTLVAWERARAAPGLAKAAADNAHSDDASMMCMCCVHV